MSGAHVLLAARRKWVREKSAPERCYPGGDAVAAMRQVASRIADRTAGGSMYHKSALTVCISLLVFGVLSSPPLAHSGTQQIGISRPTARAAEGL